MNRVRLSILLASLLGVGAFMFIRGIGWGLPSRRVDPFLFGDRPAWSGARIAQLAGSVDDNPDRAADVSSRPIQFRDRAVRVNATDSDRARIARRYRLMSNQPDEFTTFAALARMKPSRGDLDPRMYKYGGLWIYPVGALLKAGATLGLLQVKADPSYYLDHPEAFGRFYVVARLYSALWGLIGVTAMFFLARRISGSVAAGICGGLCFIFMPVVVNAAHEAKPHLAGAVLMLLAVLAASWFVEGGRKIWAVLAAVVSGAAMGMVPSAVPVLVVLPGMVILRRVLHPTAIGGRAGRRLHCTTCVIGLGVIALFVYGLTNPYVPVNAIWSPAVLRSNVGNSSAFYKPSWFGSGLPRAALLVGLGASFVLAAVGMVGGIALAVRAARVKIEGPQEARRRVAGMLLATVTIPVAIGFVIFAARQPADYARFALPFDLLLAVEAVVAIATFVRHRGARYVCYAVLVLTAAWPGLRYGSAFVQDSTNRSTRLIAARQIADATAPDGSILATREEPAPWSLPPVNLFRWQLVLPPRQWPADEPFGGATWTVGPVDFPRGGSARDLLDSTPISWAGKPFSIQAAKASGDLPIQPTP